MSEWYAQNAQRRYPFAENANLVLGNTVLPNNLLLDAQHVELSLVRPVISLVRVVIDAPGATFYFDVVDAEAGEAYTRAIMVPLVASPGFTATGVDSNGQTRLVFGEGLDVLAEWADGVYDGTGAPLEPTTVVSHAELRLVSLIGQADSDEVDGDIYLQEGHNIRVRLGSGRIRIDAIPGAGAGFPCVVQPVADELDCSQFAQFINGVPAGPDGKLDLTGGPGVQVINDPASHTIILEFDTRETDRECV